MSDIWVTYDAKPWIERHLQTQHKGFEFGSGYSTVWLGQRVGTLVSVEYDLQWYEKVKELLRKNNLNNVNLICQPDLDLFPGVIDTCADGSLDFVFVDGRQRVRCVQHSMTKIRQGGMLILDNSERPRYAAAFVMLNSWKSIHFKGKGRGGEWQTSIWVKP